MPILGLRGTGSFTVSGQRPENYREAVLYLFPNGKAPLTALLSKLKSKKVDDQRIHWYTKDIPSQRLRINNAAGYGAGELLFTVDTTNDTNGVAGAKSVRTGMVLKVERTGEIMWVTDDPINDTQIQVSRAMGEAGQLGGTAAALVDDDWISIIGDANEEGGDLPAAIGYDPTHFQNFIQTFRSPLYMTEIAKLTKLRTGDNWKEAKREALMLMSIRKEMAYFFGEPKESVGAKGQPMYTTGGLEYFLNKYCSENVIDTGATLTEAEWDTYLEQGFRYGSTEKLFLCGSGFLKVLATMAKNGGIQMTQVAKEDAYGMDLLKYLCPFGTVYLKSHPLFSAHPARRNQGFLLDTADLEEQYIRDTKYMTNRQNAGEDAQADEYLGDFGLYVGSAKKHLYIKGNSASFTFEP